MFSPIIEEFAKILMREIRDEAIENCDMALDPEANGSVAKRWRHLLEHSSPLEIAKTVIADSIDSAICKLLMAIDNGSLKLSFTASDGTIVDLNKEGQEEMAGEFMYSEGWRARYSKQRFVDDFKDLG